MTNPPVFAKVADDGSGSTGAVADTVCFSGPIPHTYKEGTDIIPSIYCSFTDGTDERAVKWEFECTISNPTCEFSVNSTLTDTHYRRRIALDTISGTSSEISAMILCRLARITNGGDEYDGSVSVFEVDFH
jgi:hypothetical protein